MRIRRARWLGFACAVSAVNAAEVPRPPQQMGLSTDGAYVLDAQAEVAWPRCAEGMRWTGKTCAGTARLFSHAEAMAWALDREAAGGVRWRVPRVRELQRLVPKAGKLAGPDAQLFPGAPRGWHWAATASIDSATVNQYDYGNIARGRNEQNANHIAFLHGWAVNLTSGEARGDVAKRTRLPLRLALSLD